MGSVPALGTWGFSYSAGLHVEEVCVGLVATATVLKFVICPGQGILNFPSVLGPINYKLHSGLGARVTTLKRPSLFLIFFLFFCLNFVYMYMYKCGFMYTSSVHMMMKAYMEARRRYWVPRSWNCQP